MDTTGEDDFGEIHRAGEAALSRAFDQLKRKPVSEAFKKTAKSMVPAAPWTAQLKEKLAPHLSDMRAFGDKVRKIRPVILFVEDHQFARSLVQRALEGKTTRLPSHTTGQRR